MRLMKYFIVVLFLLVAVPAMEQEAEAGGTSFHFGVSTYPAYWGSYYGGFYGYHPYYRPYRYYYRPYYYYRPFGYYGYGYPYYQPYSRYGYYGLGELRIEVKPKEARVYVDGDYVGVVDDYDSWWQRLRLPIGKHRIVVRAPGFAPYAETMRILPGEDQHLKFEMRPGEDVIDEREMRAERDERDRYDRYQDRYDRYDRNRRRDRDPYDYRDRDRDRRDRDQFEPRSERLPPDRYERERTEPYGTRDQNAPPASPSDRQTFTLQITPPDATVYIDGNYYGTSEDNGGGEVRVLLPEGVHQVEVVRPGYESFSKEVRVGEGADDRLIVNLQKK